MSLGVVCFVLAFNQGSGQWPCPTVFNNQNVPQECGVMLTDADIAYAWQVSPLGDVTTDIVVSDDVMTAMALFDDEPEPVCFRSF